MYVPTQVSLLKTLKLNDQRRRERQAAQRLKNNYCARREIYAPGAQRRFSWAASYFRTNAGWVQIGELMEENARDTR